MGTGPRARDSGTAVGLTGCTSSPPFALSAAEDGAHLEGEVVVRGGVKGGRWVGVAGKLAAPLRLAGRAGLETVEGDSCEAREAVAARLGLSNIEASMETVRERMPVWAVREEEGGDRGNVYTTNTRDNKKRRSGCGDILTVRKHSGHTVIFRPLAGSKQIRHCRFSSP